MCDRTDTFETKDMYIFYSSVIYLPAYTQDRIIMERSEVQINDDDVEYVNNDPDTQLRMTLLHKFTPNKLYYYYDFYDKM